MTETGVDPKIAAATQKIAGVAALHQIRKLVDSEVAEEKTKSRWAKRISVTVCVAGICAISWLLYAILR